MDLDVQCDEMCGIGLIVNQNFSDEISKLPTLSGQDLVESKESDVLNNCKWLKSQVVQFTMQLKTALSRRGPTETSERICPSIRTDSLLLIGSVLHIQGEKYEKQPISNDQGLSLVWNGEVFGGLKFPNSLSDTSAIFQHITSYLSSLSDGISRESVLCGVIDCLSIIQGPYAFIFIDHHSQQVIYGRDPFGRRSLLLGNCILSEARDNMEGNQYCVAISSMSISWEGISWEEIPIGGIYSIPFDGNLQHQLFQPWKTDQLRLYRELIGPSEINPAILSQAVNQFSDTLHFVLQNRLQKCIDFSSSRDSTSLSPKSKIGVLFSGGIDSLLLAVVLHQTLSDPKEPIDLLNVAFIDQPDLFMTAPDRLSGIIAFLELKNLFPTRPWRLVHVDVSSEERARYEDHIKQLITPLETHMDLNIGTAFWFASRGIGYLRSYPHLDSHQLYTIMNDHGRPLVRIGEEGALRSKGIDPSKHSDPKEGEMENTNSSSQKERKAQKLACSYPNCQRVAKFGCTNGYCKRCCDLQYRQSMINTFEEKTTIQLQSLSNPCPVHRSKPSQKDAMKSHLPLVNSKGETITLEAERELTSSPSLSPSFFLKNEEAIPYQSECKILLVGLGADEQLAGYGRHRTVYSHGGNLALAEEINKDLTRLWQRNLGRDDRCVSDHGREVWFPYLDEALVSLIQSLPLAVIADLSLPQGVGDKRILRLTAQQQGIHLHLIQLVKRAIQFGTLAAKQTSIQYYGSRRKGKGDSKITKSELEISEEN